MKAGFYLARGAALVVLLGGCQASVNANAQAKVDGEGASAEADGWAELSGKGELERRPPSDSNGLVASAEASGDLPASRVLLGARHDLKLGAGKATASCQCLNVALGNAGTPGMTWSGTAPQLDDSTQLSIALSSEGVECKGEPKDSLGASYWGYRIDGNDVIVLVEAARGGRPLTTGAIIPRPVGAGRVYVAPTSKKLPYGRAAEGAGGCKIGNPGPIRASAFTQLELGADAPPAATKPTPDDDVQSIEMQGN